MLPTRGCPTTGQTASNKEKNDIPKPLRVHGQPYIRFLLQQYLCKLFAVANRKMMRLFGSCNHNVIPIAFLCQADFLNILHRYFYLNADMFDDIPTYNFPISQIYIHISDRRQTHEYKPRWHYTYQYRCQIPVARPWQAQTQYKPR